MSVDRTSAPQPLYNLLGNLNNVLVNMKPADLAGLSQGLSGLVGHEDDIRNGLAAWAQVGETLGQEALGRAHEEDRLFQPAAAPHEPDLLAGVLGVVPGIGLVGDEVGEGGGEHGQVDVDGHPTAQPAQVVVEARPRPVADELPVDVLAVGQAEEVARAGAEVVGQRRHRCLERVDRRHLRLTPGDVARRERSRAGHHLVEDAVGRRERVLGNALRPHAVAGLDLVGVADRVTGELRGRRPQTVHLGAQPPPPRRLEVGVGVEVGEELPGGFAQLRGRTGWLGRSARREPGRPVVGVDQAVDVAPESQPEREVSLDQRVGAHPRRARRNSSVRTQAVRACSSWYVPIGFSSLAKACPAS